MVRRSALPKVLCLTSALLLLPIFAAQKWTIFSANGLEVLAIRMGSRIAAAALWNGELVV